MFARLRSLSLALAAPLILWGCVLAPGKFVSTLTINADRSFAFSYVGEVYAVDLGKAFEKGLKGDDDDDSSDGTPSDAAGDEAKARKIALQDKHAMPGKTLDDKSEDGDTKNRAIAEALAKEPGYRKAEYVGDGKFLIDYAASGKLTYPFLFPFNSDAEAIFPFLTIELRGPDRVRVKAPAFGDGDGGSKGGMGSGDFPNRVDGTFTLVTDAEIVSQNNENGATTAGAKKTITWRATPTTKDTPLAVLKLAPLH